MKEKDFYKPGFYYSHKLWNKKAWSWDTKDIRPGTLRVRIKREYFEANKISREVIRRVAVGEMYW